MTYQRIWVCPVQNDGDGDYVAIVYAVFERINDAPHLLNCVWTYHYL